MKKTIFLAILGIFLAFGVQAAVGDNVSGYAWSENIGWINFNGSNYGVNIEQNGKFSGYAWSENIGWINFAPIGPYPSSPNYSACLDFAGPGQTCDGLGTNKVGGWARVCSVFAAGCSGELIPPEYRGGWDGWIKLRGSNYGVDYAPQSGELSGFAWSDMVIGWISFKGVNYVVVTIAKLPPSVSTDGETWNHCSFEGKSIPILNWNYSDGTQVAYWVQIDNTAASFPSPEVDTGEILSSSQSYAPTYNFNWDTKYWWRVKAKNQQGVWSNWSNIDDFTTPEHAYPWSGFSWLPQEPNQGEVVVFDPEETNVYYLWTFNQGALDTYEPADGTSETSEEPHIKFLISNNKAKLKVTDKTSQVYSCESEEKEITAQMPLPEYKEVPPIIWLKKLFAALVNSNQQLGRIVGAFYS